MNTTFILAGGNDKLYPDFGARLARFIKNEVASPVILNCLFARPPEIWPDREVFWHDWYERYFGDDTQIIDARPDSFYEQIAQTDVVYLHGGTTKLLQAALPDASKFQKAIQGKIVIGSSAGANYLSSVYYSPSADAVSKGSGIVDIATVVHYGIGDFDGHAITATRWQEVSDMVTRMYAGPVHLIPEGEFIAMRAEEV